MKINKFLKKLEDRIKDRSEEIEKALVKV